MTDRIEYLGHSSSDFENYFDPDEYLTYFKDVRQTGTFWESEMQDFHYYFSQMNTAGTTLLDIGSGPCIHSVISASKIFPRILLSDYTASNRRVLQDWMDGKDSSFDWSPFMEYVANMENENVETVKSRVKQSIEGVIGSDILSPGIVQDTLSFDCITSSACLESACHDLDTYSRSVKYIYNLLNPGAHVVVFGYLGNKFYKVGKSVFGALTLRRQEILDVFHAAGFVDIISRVHSHCAGDKQDFDHNEGCMTLCAKKPQ